MRSIFSWRHTFLLATFAAIHHVNAFTISSASKVHSSLHSTVYSAGQKNIWWTRRSTQTRLALSHTDSNILHKVSEDDETPIPFVESDNSAFIECYADSIAIINGVEYTIGSPCDHAVALCYFDDEEELIPIELDEDLMDKIFNLAASIVEEEFGEELSLERTPQTLTLVGELEEGEEDDEDEDDEDMMNEDEEDVEVLLSFEHDDTEYCLVRLLDPVLLVGKGIFGDKQRVKLLTPEESDKVMPILEEMFLNSRDDIS